MKKKALLPITIAALLFLGACNNNSSVSDQGHSALDVSISSVTDSSSVFIDDTSAGSYYSSVSVPTPGAARDGPAAPVRCHPAVYPCAGRRRGRTGAGADLHDRLQ